MQPPGEGIGAHYRSPFFPVQAATENTGSELSESGEWGRSSSLTDSPGRTLSSVQEAPPQRFAVIPSPGPSLSGGRSAVWTLSGREVWDASAVERPAPSAATLYEVA